MSSKRVRLSTGGELVEEFLSAVQSASNIELRMLVRLLVKERKANLSWPYFMVFEITDDLLNLAMERNLGPERQAFLSLFHDKTIDRLPVAEVILALEGTASATNVVLVVSHLVARSASVPAWLERTIAALTLTYGDSAPARAVLRRCGTVAVNPLHVKAFALLFAERPPAENDPFKIVMGEDEGWIAELCKACDRATSICAHTSPPPDLSLLRSALSEHWTMRPDGFLSHHCLLWKKLEEVEDGLVVSALERNLLLGEGEDEERVG